MNTSEQYFMTVVELESISHAAESLFVSQQNLSNHIKRLENKYGVLFTRRPKFALTSVGKIFYSTLCQVHNLENDCLLQIQDVNNDQSGVIRFGIHTARARVLLPTIIGEMQKKYPQVRLEIIHADTSEYEEMLEKGTIDLFLGINAEKRSGFDYLNLPQEKIYLIATHKLLSKYGLKKSGDHLTCAEISKLPLFFSSTTSSLQNKINDFFKSKNTMILPRVAVGDFFIQLQLVQNNLGACFCPQLFFSKQALANNKLKKTAQKYTVDGLSIKNELSIVTNVKAYYPVYMKEFIGILKNTVCACLNE